MHVSLSASTEDALLAIARHGPFDVVISDMGRDQNDLAGYELLGLLRRGGIVTPYVIYASSGAPEHFDEAVRRGAMGSTNRPDELIRLVSSALPAERDRLWPS